LAGGAQRRGEVDLEAVAALDERVGDIEAPGAVLVLHLGDAAAVEHHGGGGVEGLCDQVDAVGARRLPVEARGVQDIAVAGPGQLPLGRVQVGGGGQPGGLEGGGPRAGHRGGHIVPGEGGRPVGDGHRPAVMEGTTADRGGAGEGHGVSSAGARWSGMGTPRRWASARNRGLLPGSGAATSSCLVNVARGRRMTSSASPRSTTSPRYITRISSEKWRAVARSWVM